MGFYWYIVDKCWYMMVDWFISWVQLISCPILSSHPQSSWFIVLKLKLNHFVGSWSQNFSGELTLPSRCGRKFPPARLEIGVEGLKSFSAERFVGYLPASSSATASCLTRMKAETHESGSCPWCLRKGLPYVAMLHCWPHLAQEEAEQGLLDSILKLMRRVTIPASLEEDEKAALLWSSSLTLFSS